VGGRRAIVPRITGQAWIYGTETLRMDDGDPFRNGFVLSDLWGPHLG
jgi:proline racemase